MKVQLVRNYVIDNNFTICKIFSAKCIYSKPLRSYDQKEHFSLTSSLFSASVVCARKVVDLKRKESSRNVKGNSLFTQLPTQILSVKLEMQNT